MPKIDFAPLDVMTVLEVERQFDEEAFCEFYAVNQGDLRLDVAMMMAEPRVEISLHHMGQRLMQFSFWCGQIRRVIDGRGELLQFSNCIIGNPHLTGESTSVDTPTCSLLLWIKPHIRIQLA